MRILEVKGGVIHPCFLVYPLLFPLNQTANIRRVHETTKSLSTFLLNFIDNCICLNFVVTLQAQRICDEDTRHTETIRYAATGRSDTEDTGR